MSYCCLFLPDLELVSRCGETAAFSDGCLESRLKKGILKSAQPLKSFEFLRQNTAHGAKRPIPRGAFSKSLTRRVGWDAWRQTGSILALARNKEQALL